MGLAQKQLAGLQESIATQETQSIRIALFSLTLPETKVGAMSSDGSFVKAMPKVQRFMDSVSVSTIYAFKSNKLYLIDFCCFKD